MRLKGRIVVTACAPLALVCLAASNFPATAQTIKAKRELELCYKGAAVARTDRQASLEQYRAACVTAIRAHWDKPLRGILYNNLAEMRRMRGDMEGAIAEFNPLIRENRITGLGYRSFFLSRNHFHDRALADSDERVRLEPSKAGVYESRAHVHAALNNFDLALRDFSEAIRLDPTNASSSLAGRAEVWGTKRDAERAFADMDQAIRLKPNDLDFAVRRANLRLELRGDVDGALRELDAVLMRDPKFTNAYLTRGNLWLYHKGDAEKALADYAQAERLRPDDPVSRVNIAVLYLKRGEYDKGLEKCDEALRIDPSWLSAYSTRGELWRLKGDLDRSLQDLDTAVRLFPRGPLYLSRRGDTWRYKGDMARAIADFNLALSIAPDFTHALVGRGLTYERMGDNDRAKADFQSGVAVPAYRYPGAHGDQETARARLAALKEGAPLPKILPVPGKATSNTSLPTPKVALTAITPESVRLTQTREGRRAALVIGNSNYTNAGTLAPQRDAQAVSGALRKLGFDVVTLANDATREKLLETLRAFAEEADKADWALVYYAGHGIEVSGANYLIPIEAKLKADRDVQFEAVALDQVMAAVEGAKKLRVVVLDACRDNPFLPQTRTVAIETVAVPSSTGRALGTRSLGRGLGEVRVSGATLVVYAAKHGQTALDGEGDNSPFAVALLQRIATPGIEINKLFRLVRDDVMEATAGRQEPFTYGSLPGRDFFFLAAN